MKPTVKYEKLLNCFEVSMISESEYFTREEFEQFIKDCKTELEKCYATAQVLPTAQETLRIYLSYGSIWNMKDPSGKLHTCADIKRLEQWAKDNGYNTRIEK